MRVDFYQLSRDGVEQVVPLLARKVLESGSRLAVVHGDADARSALSEALWNAEGTFLANGEAGAAHAEHQPVLLCADGSRANDASMAIVADGEWRDMAGYDRVMLLFGQEQTDAARALWKEIGGTDGCDLHIFKQGPDGNWREGR